MLGDLSSVWGRHLAPHLHVCMRNAKRKTIRNYANLHPHPHPHHHHQNPVPTVLRFRPLAAEATVVAVKIISHFGQHIRLGGHQCYIAAGEERISLTSQFS